MSVAEGCGAGLLYGLLRQTEWLSGYMQRYYKNNFTCEGQFSAWLSHVVSPPLDLLAFVFVPPTNTHGYGSPKAPFGEERFTDSV